MLERIHRGRYRAADVVYGEEPITTRYKFSISWNRRREISPSRAIDGSADMA